MRLVLGHWMLSVFATAPVAFAQVIEFDEDKAGWIDAVGDFATVHFTDLAQLQFISDEYEKLGVLFTDGTDVAGPGGCSFATDLAGCIGNDDIHLQFDSPMNWIACDFPGSVQFDLLNEGRLVYTSSEFLSSGCCHFAGVLAGETFDAAIITDPLGGVVIDNLLFGPAAPTEVPEIEDCNGNGFVDFCDQFDVSLDCNDNDIPDECEVPAPCPGDADRNCCVNVQDLVAVISAWGQIESSADVTADGIVDVDDLVQVIVNWGPC